MGNPGTSDGEAERGCTSPSAAESFSCCTSPAMPQSMRQSTVPWTVDRFELHKKIYEGKTSRLYVATDKPSGTPVALKLYRKHKLTLLNKCQVEREINIHIRVAHENIIQLYAAFEDADNVYLVQELAGGGDLFYKVKGSAGRQFNEQKTVEDVVLPFLNALKYLHSQGIIHRDIKPENILLTSSDTIKLADFGLAIDTNEERPVTRLGTLDYMAPEVLTCPDKSLPEQNKDMEGIQYAAQVDTWAVGVLAYELLVGYAPFDKGSRMATYENIVKGEPEFPIWVSRNAKSFIRAALCKVAHKRPTAVELLHHPWLQPFLIDKSRRSLLAMHRTSSVPRMDMLAPPSMPGRERDTRDFTQLAMAPDVVDEEPDNLQPLPSHPSLSDPGFQQEAGMPRNSDALQAAGLDQLLQSEPAVTRPRQPPRSPAPAAQGTSLFSSGGLFDGDGEGEAGDAVWRSDLSPLISAFQSQEFGLQRQLSSPVLAGSRLSRPANYQQGDRSSRTSLAHQERPSFSRARSGILSDDSHLISLGAAAPPSPKAHGILSARAGKKGLPPLSPSEGSPSGGPEQPGSGKSGKRSMYSKIFSKLWGGKGSEGASTAHGMARSHPSSPNLSGAENGSSSLSPNSPPTRALSTLSPTSPPLLYSRNSPLNSPLNRSTQDLTVFISAQQWPLNKPAAPCSPSPVDSRASPKPFPKMSFEEVQQQAARLGYPSPPNSGQACCPTAEEAADECGGQFRRLNSDHFARPPAESPGSCSRSKAKHLARRLLSSSLMP